MSAKSLTVFVAAMLAASCGFHLRTYDFESSVDSFSIAGKTRITIAAPLRRALTQAGVDEARSAQADVVIDLLDERNERRSASTVGQSRAAEYEMTYAVQYRILGADGEELAPPTWIQRDRIYRIDRGNIVGSSGEQEILRQEMLQDVVGQIIRALDAVSRSDNATG